MIETRTVFILGAGASHPYGYPTSNELIDWIRISFIDSSEQQLLSTPMMIDHWPEAHQFIDVLTRSRTPSIDLFLSRNPEFATMGKIAVACAILTAEMGSTFREAMSRDKAKFDWYTVLLTRLTEDLTKKTDYDRLADNRVSFITFNYDRSLEHFLSESLIHSFHGTSPEGIRRILQAIPIIHVYGQVAPLDWQEFCDAETGIPHGTNVNQVSVPDLIDNLHVMYEERRDPDLERSRTLLSEADRIFFLGFGYAKENLEILGLPDALRPGQYVYGTAMGLTQKEIERIEMLLRQGLKRPQNPGHVLGEIHLNRDFDCVALLREHL